MVRHQSALSFQATTPHQPTDDNIYRRRTINTPRRLIRQLSPCYPHTIRGGDLPEVQLRQVYKGCRMYLRPQVLGHGL